MKEENYLKIKVFITGVVILLLVGSFSGGFFLGKRSILKEEVLQNIYKEEKQEEKRKSTPIPESGEAKIIEKEINPTSTIIPQKIDEQEKNTNKKEYKKIKEKEEVYSSDSSVTLDEYFSYERFENVFGAVCTEDQIRTLKNQVAETVKKSKVCKGVKKLVCSKYTRMDEEQTRLIAYILAEDKEVYELSYSVRYGKGTINKSKYTAKDISELEVYGKRKNES